MDCHIHFLVTFLFLKVQISNQWKAPSFISQWYDVEAMVTGDFPIEHGLGEVPAKVDVQIKVIQNNEFIFTGTGTAQRDDDYVEDFGGVVYLYNNVHVILYPPYMGVVTVTSGGIAFTGYSSHFDGPSSARGLYSSGHVRVRAWKSSDFPTPLFSLSIGISTNSGDQFIEQLHGSTVMPDIVIAQVLLDDGYISEGQGNIFQHESDNFNTLSGVVFGYNEEKVQIWVPAFSVAEFMGNPICSGTVYAHNDGWGSTNKCKTSGTVKLNGYQLTKAFQTTFPAGHGIASNSTIDLKNNYSLDSALVWVQVKQDGSGNGNIENMIFNGVGSAMPSHMKYSGVVYVYTENSVLLYIPTSTNTNGYMIYLGDSWGNYQSLTYSHTADVIVTVFSEVCPDPSVSKTVMNLTNGLVEGSVVQYSCASGYVYISGYLTRTCSSGAWDGTDPVCTQLKCNDPGSIYNATYNVTGLSPSNTATYTCNPGNQQLAGDAERVCQADGTWSGIPIVCIDMPTCSITVPVANTSNKLGNMEQRLNDLRIDIKETNAYHRRHTSAYDPRPSALYIGTAGVVLLCSVVAALVLPDFISLFRHMRNFTDIYKK